MNKDNVIQAKVQELVDSNTMFTSVDVTRALWDDGHTEVHCGDVRAWLKKEFKPRGGASPVTGGDTYVTEHITVKNGTVGATLYLPGWADSDDYQDRDQDASYPTTQQASTAPAATQPVTKPVTSKSMRVKGSPSAPKPMTTTDGNPDVDDVLSDADDVDESDIIQSKVIGTTERVKIPGSMIRQIGWQPGDTVDLSRIHTHVAVPARLKVNADGRVSIPRCSLNWDMKPVRVCLTKDLDIVFQKA